MRSVLITATALIALGGSACAADMRLKAPVAQADSWTGIYLGGSVGVAVGNSKDFCIADDNACIKNADNANWTGGGHIGVQWQTGQWVIGAEGKWIATDLNTSSSCPNADFNCRLHIDSYWTAGARLGYVVGNGLFYATGGYAQSKIDRDALFKPAGVVQETWSATHSGWFIGTGAEFRVAGTGWVLGVEYNHIDFGSKTATGSGQFNQVASVKPNIDTFQGRVSYLFNWR